MEKVILLGIAGGSGSGKTTVTHEIAKPFNEDIVVLEQDSYYKNLSGMSIDERSKINFDHPDSIDIELFVKHLETLLKWESIQKPIYNFKIHNRDVELTLVNPAKIVIIEGILIFAIPELRKMFDVKIFVDTDDDVRLLRRIERDMKERGRSFDSIKEQYLNTVKPMYLEFVEPSKRYGDIIIPRGGKNKVAVNMVIAKLRHLLRS